MLRRLWRAASRPEAHFETTRDHEPRLGGSLLEALAASAFGLLVAALALARATGSDGLGALALVVVTGGLLAVLAAWLLGGLALVRPAGLDLRAWEIAATAWLPAGALGLSLLPTALLFPAASLAVGLLLLPAWHLAIVRAGLRVHVPHRAGRLTLLYALVVFALPLGLGLGTAWLLYTGARATG